MKNKLIDKAYEQRIHQATQALQKALQETLDPATKTNEVKLIDLPLEFGTEGGIITISLAHTQYWCKNKPVVRYNFYGKVMNFGYEILTGEDAKHTPKTSGRIVGVDGKPL